MPRLNGTIATKKCWRVIIKQGINILHNEDYTTLKVASQENKKRLVILNFTLILK